MREICGKIMGRRIDMERFFKIGKLYEAVEEGYEERNERFYVQIVGAFIHNRKEYAVGVILPNDKSLPCLAYIFEQSGSAVEGSVFDIYVEEEIMPNNKGKMPWSIKVVKS